MRVEKIIIGCAIPCFRGGQETIKTIKSALNFVDHIVLVDDKQLFQTGKDVEKIFSNEDRVEVVYNSRNLGVEALPKELLRFYCKKCQIIVKVDADGQINPELIPSLIRPLIEGEFDAAKGNRFSSFRSSSFNAFYKSCW